MSQLSSDSKSLKVAIDNFKDVYFRNGKFNLEVQVPHLINLGKHYEEKYKSTNCWTDCLKAHSLFNSALRRKHDDNLDRRVFKLQQTYWGDQCSASYKQQMKITTELKADIESIRERFRYENKRAASLVSQFTVDNSCDSATVQSEYYSLMKGISSDCSEAMREFAAKIIELSVQILAIPPPCVFTAVAIGSLAKGEATPYSDLEYMFLTETKAPETVRYFELLAVTKYFMIGNLAETKLSYMGIEELKGWFDDRAKNGFKIDGLSVEAGNIPTGNGSVGTKNRYIITPEELAARYKYTLNNPDEESLRGDLTAMLTYTTPLYTNQEKEAGEKLLTKFRDLISKLEINEARRAANMSMLQTDARKFNFVPDIGLVRKCFIVDVKKELYRFPSIMALDIALVCDHHGKSSWVTIESLKYNNYISEYLWDTLKFLLAAATYIRLATYLYHDSHDDRMSISPTILQANNSKLDQSLGRWYIPIGLFSKVCVIMCPLKEFLAHTNLNATKLNEISIISDPWWTTIKTLYYSGRTEQVFSKLTQRYPVLCEDPVNELRTQCEKPTQKNEETLFIISETLLACRKVAAALKIYIHMTGTTSLFAWKRVAQCHILLEEYEQALEALNSLPNMRSDDLGLIGQAYNGLGRYAEAEDILIIVVQTKMNNASVEVLYDYYGNPLYQDGHERNSLALSSAPSEKRLKIITALRPISEVNIHYELYVLGDVFFDQKKYRLAEGYYLKSLEFINQLFGNDAAVSEAAQVQGKLGTLYKDTKQYSKAEESYNHALAIYREISQGAPSEDTANTLNNLGSLYADIKRNSKAEESYNQALTIYREIPQGAPSVDTAKTLSNLGNLYNNMTQYSKAEESFNQALAILRETSQGAPSVDTAKTLFNLGNLYTDIKLNSKAEESYNQALAIYRGISHGAVSVDTANTLNNLGNLYKDRKEYSKSEESYNQALAIYREISQGAPSVDTAKTLSNLGDLYASMSQYSKAHRSYFRSLALFRKTSQGLPNHNTAIVLNNLGNLYKDMKQYSKAEESYNHALDIYAETSQGAPCVNIANTLCFLGILYRDTKQCSKAEESYNQALAIYRETSQGAPSVNTAITLYNLGNLYADMTQYAKQRRAFCKH